MAHDSTLDPEATMAVKVFSPREVYYDGSATSLTAENETGVFDVLPLHHSFITLLKAGTISIAVDKNKKKEFEIAKGLLRAKNNTVVVFLDV